MSIFLGQGQFFHYSLYQRYLWMTLSGHFSVSICDGFLFFQLRLRPFLLEGVLTGILKSVFGV